MVNENYLMVIYNAIHCYTTDPSKCLKLDTKLYPPIIHILFRYIQEYFE